MMTTRFRAMAALLAAGVLLLAAGGAAGAQTRFLTTQSPSWQRYFTIEWMPASRNGKTGIEGRIRNEGNFVATRIGLLVDALDASGNVVDQRLVWLLPPDLTPGTRGYFETPIAGPAASYRVSVYTFNWKRTG